jgi:hypothetical protein
LPHGIQGNKQNSASSMSRQFQVIGVPLFDNEMIALAGKNGANISKQMKREELMGIPEYGFEVHWDKEAQIRFLVSHST